jgi:CelD/BcsL family acetyltransferase involved in cellulose biosynthesis
MSDVISWPDELAERGRAGRSFGGPHDHPAPSCGDENGQTLPLTPRPPLSSGSDTSSAASSASGIRLHIHGDLDEVGPQWKAFAENADGTVFQSFEWLAAWQRHIGRARATVPVIVLGHDGDGELLFLLPLAIDSTGLVRRLTFLGSQLCDYNAPLLAPQFADRISAERFVLAWREIVALLRTAPCFRFDLVDLQKMPEAVGGQRNPFLDLAVSAHPSGAYVATLGGDWDEFYAAKRSASTRKRERRQFKQLAAYGEVRFIDVTGEREIAHTVATLIEQKSRTFARMGVADLFARRGWREFYHAIAAEPAIRDRIQVGRLQVGSDIAATNIGLKFRNCYYLILSSYAEGELARFGPGRAHLNELLRYAIEDGFTRFDFTVGDEPYKRDWADIEVRLFDYLAGHTLRGAGAAALTRAFRRAKRCIKQSPTLWSAFSRARALTANAVRR